MEPPGEQPAQEVIKQRTLQVDVCPQEATGCLSLRTFHVGVCLQEATGCLSLRTLQVGVCPQEAPGCLPLRMPVGQQLGQGLLLSLALCACFTRLSAEGGAPAWDQPVFPWHVSFLPLLIACSGTFFSDSEASSSIRGNAGS